MDNTEVNIYLLNGTEITAYLKPEEIYILCEEIGCIRTNGILKIHVVEKDVITCIPHKNILYITIVTKK